MLQGSQTARGLSALGAKGLSEPDAKWLHQGVIEKTRGKS